jgi:alpha-amylase
MFRRSLAALSATAVAVALAGSALFLQSAPPASASPPAGQNDTIVHLFEWNWPSIGRECTSVLGPKGYGAVQVSPPQEHIVLAGNGYPWWQDYQPISYQLVTRRGDRAAFASMVSTCHAAGVKIYVDAVLNHMQGANQSGLGSAGNLYSNLSDPAVPYSSSDFHTPCAIASYQDRTQVQTCQLSLLTDLATESTYVRGKEDDYLNDLISLGVDGFRLDAAKHMPVADIAAIKAGLTKPSSYLYQEVIEGGNGEISPTEYTGTGDVTDFRYGDVVGGAFQNGSLSNLLNLPSQMLLATDKAQVFIDNHDTERNGRTKLNYKNGDRYYLAEGFMLAYPFGTASVMSGYNWSSADQGPPATSNGTTLDADCSNGWTCQHRDRRIENMVGLRNTARGTAITNWWSNGGSQIAFGRGSVAYVAFNTDGSSLTRTFQTSLPAGSYCDVMSGDYSAGNCSGTSYTVGSSGTFTATLGANTSLALYLGAGGPTATPTSTATATSSVPAGQVASTFSVAAGPASGQSVYVVGNVEALGSWNTTNAVALASAEGRWSATVNLPANTAFEYKYIYKTASGAVTWEREGVGNRVRTSGASGTSITYTETFNG